MNAVVAKREVSSSAAVAEAAGVGTSDSVDLAQILVRHPWLLCHDPFPHIRAENVFTPAVYRELATAFDDILNGRDNSSWPGARFSRSIPGYDASAVSLEGCFAWPFSIFASRPWHDLFASLFSIDSCDCVAGALHHHEPMSQDGFIHSDFNTAWFIDTTRRDGIKIPDGHRCDYRRGVLTPNAGIEARETIRGVAIIYYLNNPEWREGDGGETGLYRCGRDQVENAVVSVPPVSNSLVAFECTPHSFHTFRKNHRHPRNSVIVWVHQRKEAAIARWGDSAIERWQ